MMWTDWFQYDVKEPMIQDSAVYGSRKKEGLIYLSSELNRGVLIINARGSFENLQPKYTIYQSRLSI